MSETTITPAPAGTGALTVEGAANAFADLMNDDGEFAPKPEPKKAKAKAIEPVEDEEEDTDPTPDAEDSDDELDPEDGDTEDGDAAEGEDDESEQDESEDDEGPDDEEDEEALIPVKIDGKVEKLTLDELKKGYSRTAVFTKKTQEAAELRKQAEADRATIAQERAILASALKEVEERITTLEPEPDWDALRAKDPAEWTYQRQVWAEKQEERRKLAEVAAEMQRRNAADHAAQLAERVAAEQAALLEKAPAWKDPAKAKAELETISTYAKNLGFTDEDLNSVVDHRMLLLLRDASRYQTLLRRTDAMTKKSASGGEKTTKGEDSALDKIRPLTPRKSRGKVGRVEARQKAVARVAQTGRLDDAAKAFEMLLPDF